MTNGTDKTARDRHNGQPANPVNFNPVEQEVLDELNEMGFDRPVEFIRKFTARRIDRALALLRAKPAGDVKKPAAFIRYLVAAPHGLPPVPAMAPAGNRFITDPGKFQKQKFGHLVKR